MYRILIFIPILLLSSCTFGSQDKNTLAIQELQLTIEKLTAENQKLNTESQKLNEENQRLIEENTSLKIGLDAPSFGADDPAGNVATPENMTFEETSSKECVEKARAAYVEMGNTQCKQMGFSQEDIAARKCKLTKTFMEVMNKKLMDDELACGPGQ